MSGAGRPALRDSFAEKHDQLSPVIAGPAETAGIELETGLAEALIADAQSDDALPLLAFTLREWYDRAGERRKLITLRDYYDLGRLEGGVAQSAGQLVAGLNAEQVALLRQALLRLARMTDEGRFARRVVPWNDLDSRVHSILQKFVEARLLVADERGGERVLEVAHEALFRSWTTLRGWLNESIEELHLRKDVERSAFGVGEERALRRVSGRGGRLTRTSELRKSSGFPLGPLEADFLKVSLEAEQSENRKNEARRKRSCAGRNWRQLSSLLCCLPQATSIIEPTSSKTCHWPGNSRPTQSCCAVPARTGPCPLCWRWNPCGGQRRFRDTTRCGA